MVSGRFQLASMNSSARRTCHGAAAAQVPLQQMAEIVRVGMKERHQQGLLELGQSEVGQLAVLPVELGNEKPDQLPQSPQFRLLRIGRGCKRDGLVERNSDQGAQRAAQRGCVHIEDELGKILFEIVDGRGARGDQARPVRIDMQLLRAERRDRASVQAELLAYRVDAGAMHAHREL